MIFGFGSYLLMKRWFLRPKGNPKSGSTDPDLRQRKIRRLYQLTKSWLWCFAMFAAYFGTITLRGVKRFIESIMSTHSSFNRTLGKKCPHLAKKKSSSIMIKHVTKGKCIELKSGYVVKKKCTPSNIYLFGARHLSYCTRIILGPCQEFNFLWVLIVAQ